MSFKEISIIFTDHTIVIYHKGKRHMFKSSQPGFEDIKALLKEGDEQKIVERLGKASYTIPAFSQGKFGVLDEKVIDLETNTEVEIRLAKRILSWAEQGLPFEPLLKFHRKVIQNPSKDSADDLYEFLEKNFIPITNDGNFLAYKKVTNVNGTLLDSYSKKIDNSIGNIVTMEREKVDPNRRNECSYGYHVAGWDYAHTFTGDVLLEVEVEPQDVVAVPLDYSRQKMRCCRYKVIAEVIKDSNGMPKQRTEAYVKVVKQEETKNKVKATIHGIDFESMTAQKIKDYILENYGVEITSDNKNKKAIVKKANKIVTGQE